MACGQSEVADEHYHPTSHSSLVGKSPASVFQAHPSTPDGLEEKTFADALTVRVRRRVRRDTTVALDGVDYGLDAGHLAGRLVFLCRTLADAAALPWVEVDGDAVKNARRERPYRKPHLEETAPRHPAFEPAGALLDRHPAKTASRGDLEPPLCELFFPRRMEACGRGASRRRRKAGSESKRRDVRISRCGARGWQ